MKVTVDLKLHLDTVEVYKRRREGGNVFLAPDSDQSRWLLAEHSWLNHETHFYVNGLVNSEKFSIWGTSKRDAVCDKGLRGQKVSNWAAMSYKGVTGLVSLRQEQEYRHSLVRSITLHLEHGLMGSLIGIDERRNQWFQQDGPTPHNAKIINWAWSATTSVTVVIILNTDHAWTSPSPDLNPLDFCLWEYYVEDKNRHGVRKSSGSQFCK